MGGIFYTHPCRQISLSCNWRQGIVSTQWSKTASISTYSIGSSGSSGLMSLLTKKCFRFFSGCTAVHLLRSNFFGLSWFLFLEGITLKAGAIAHQIAATRSKYLAWVLCLGRAFLIKIAFRAQTAAKVKLLILKRHLGLLENHHMLLATSISTRPCGVFLSTASA